MEFELLKQVVERAARTSPFYRNKLGDIAIESMEDFHSLPFSDKEELREAYPLGLMAVPQKDVVRIHSSSGTTGQPVIIPYTQKDVEDWAVMFERAYRMAGITEEDVIHVTPGYGLWTAGIGFQAGAERLGAMVVPMGPGNTDKQLQLMQDLKSTVLCATSSYALLLAEEIAKRGISNSICLKKGVIGSERWGDLMRERIKNELGIELYDIYGLTEIYGPGIAINCQYDHGMHYWDDYLYFEIIDSQTGRVLPRGEYGELVITTLVKEAAPLIRYRTHDLTRILPQMCPCGCGYPMIDRILGRTDDMVKVKGVNLYPGQIDSVLGSVEGVSSEYQLKIDHIDGKDRAVIKVEMQVGFDVGDVGHRLGEAMKKTLGLTMNIELVEIGSLPRSEKKSKRVFDYRDR